METRQTGKQVDVALVINIALRTQHMRYYGADLPNSETFVGNIAGTVLFQTCQFCCEVVILFSLFHMF